MSKVDLLTIVVLLIAVGSTAWLLFYTRVYLPREMNQRLSETMKAFSTAIELRFPTQKGTSTRVVRLSSQIAKKLNLSPAKIRELEMAAQLRDIGLCSLPYRMLNQRDPDQWSLAEQATYSRHAEVSGAMLEMVPGLSFLAPIVRMHHCDFDAVVDLPMESRILKLVTEYVWDEKHYGREVALDRIRDGVGASYCPQVADAFLQVLTSSHVDERAQVALA
jgi:response regulator RpfG family c-di-GMP phosphodiesterase